MTQIHIEKLDPIKLPIVQKLYKQHYPSGKAKSNELIYVSYAEKSMCGVVRIRPIDSYRLLTGMMVVPEFRHRGVGLTILDYCSQHVLSEGDYCFAYSHLEDFYTQKSFVTIELDKLPNPLRSLYERYSRSGKQLIPMKFTKSDERDT
ncbi:GNAT family N-acetyltransferase [Vibrio hannami]|uniref:GNAT family N-acetyltransferase n=1 Tax=Vibrio hannami TaxID=2717094 RepID=UPI0024101E2D|nr:GNAT family N-acetyltransferase [Vibrio hannami]MDG3084592.1 GNAT family N-acetyltransferase [Vibrio hannami]